MNFTIIIVDDSATTRACIKRTLRLAELPLGDILEAANGQAALELIRAHPPDLVLADLHMPEMNGVEMTRQLLADPATREVPVVVVSAESNQAKLEALKQQGVRGYLRKPFTPEALRNLVADILGAVHA